MATTTNYGWTTPDDTDLVRNGADAIRDLGSAIDTSMNTALGTKKAGLVLLNTTSFAAVSSVSLAADTFTTTYDNYRLLCSIQGSASSILNLRFRAAGADITTANYTYVAQALDSTATANTLTGAAQTTNQMFYTTISPRTHFVIDIFNPKATLTTNFSGSAWGLDNAAAELALYRIGGHFNLTTSFDALSFYPTSGTVTGTYQIFGYNQQEL